MNKKKNLQFYIAEIKQKCHLAATKFNTRKVQGTIFSNVRAQRSMGDAVHVVFAYLCWARLGLESTNCDPCVMQSPSSMMITIGLFCKESF